jgi:MFS superfamily sulfate permease-like transporter
LVFANAEAAFDTLRTRLATAAEKPAVVILDFESCYEIDVTAANALAELVRDLEDRGIDVRFAAAHKAVRDYVRRLHLADLDGLAHPHPTVEAAVSATRIGQPPSVNPGDQK